MASTYSPLKIELPATGEQSGTWGNTTNTNLGTAIEQAITGSGDVTFASADVTVTLTDTNAAQTARNLRLNLTGTSGGARQLILGSGCQIEKLYLINNGLADAVTVKNTTGTGIAVPAGKTMFVYNDGTNVVETVNSAVNLDVTTLDATNIEVTNIKAKDGTAAGSIANSTGVVTFASSILTTADINGGTIDNTSIGVSTPSTGAFTTLASNGANTFTAGTASTSTTTGTVVITGGLGVSGRINAANFDGIVGANTAAAGNFTTLGATGVATFSAGTVSLPAITTTGDTNTGIFFPAADTIAFTEGGTEAMRITSAGNLGIGNSSPSQKLEVSGNIKLNGTVFAAIDNGINFNGGDDSNNRIYGDALTGTLMLNSFNGFRFSQTSSGSPVERMRIDSDGNLLVNTTSIVGFGKTSIKFDQAANWGIGLQNTSATATGTFISFVNSSGTTQGAIAQTNSTTTSYSTSSDYRLKENIAPMTGALDKISQLKPVTYKWKSDNSNGQGFIAHELQAIVPDCVTGEKDGVETIDEFDKDGKKIGTKEVPKYQGIDTSFLVATLTAAIQELKAEVDSLKAQINAA